MTIERITLLGNTQGFAVGCEDCQPYEGDLAKLLYSTERDDLIGSLLAHNVAKIHELIHPDHTIVIFDFQREQ